MASSIGAFFLDTNILLNKILGEKIIRTNKVFQDIRNENIICYISISVNEECQIKIYDTINFIGETLRIFLRGAFNYYLEQQGRKIDEKFLKKDILLIREIFKHITSRHALYTPSKTIEEQIVHVIEEKLKIGQDFSFMDMMYDLTQETLRLTNMLQDKYEDLFLVKTPKINIAEEIPDQNLINRLNATFSDLHHPDTVHLASVWKYAYSSANKTVFVTEDNGILRHQNTLNVNFNIICSDPLYAIHYF